MASKEEVRRVSIFINGDEADLTLKQLEKGSRKLRAELALLVPGTEEFKKKMLELRETTAVLDDIKKDIKGVGGAFGWLKTEIGKLGVLATGYLGFQFVTDQFKNIISQNGKLADSISDIQKTTGLSELQVRRLQQSFKSIDTRSSRSELDSLAEVAGKLGINSEQDVLGFVRAADKINVALGKDLGNAEEAINDLGKLTDIFHIKDAYGLENALLRTGSAINDLGAAGTANEGYIVEFTKRLGGIAPQANMSIQDVMGLAATMDELGQPVEAAATSIGQFVVGMGNDIPRFAKIAKMSIADFSKLLQTDGNAALIAVLKNLNSTGQGVKGLAENMGLVGEDGARATAALGLLSNNIDKLQERQALSNNSFEKGISLTNEYNIKNNNFGATLDKVGKKISALTSNHTLTDFLQKGTELTGDFVDWLNKSMGTIAMFIQLLIAGAAGYVAYNVVVKLATVSQRAWWATLLESEAVTKLLMLSEAAWTALKLVLTGRIKEARAAMIGFNAVMEANPIGLVIGAITALVAAMYFLNDEVSDATKIQQALNDVQAAAASKTVEEKQRIKALTDVINDHNESRENQIQAIKKLRELLPDHLQGYTDEQILAGKATKAIDDYIDALDRRAAAEAAQDALTEIAKKRIKINSERGDISFWQVVKSNLMQAGSPGADFREGYRLQNKKEELDLLDQQEAAIKSNYKADLRKAALGTPTKSNGGFDLANATKDELSQQLVKDEKALAQLKRGTAEYNKVAAEMVAIRKRLKEIDKDTGVGGGGHGDPAAEMLKRSRAMSQMVKDFNAQQLADLQTKNQKEVADTENAHNERIDKLKAFLLNNKNNKNLSDEERQKHQDEIDDLERKKVNAANAVRVRQEKELLEKISDLRGSLGDVYQTELDKELIRINDFYDDQLAIGADACTVEENRAKDLADARIREARRFQEESEQIDRDGITAGKTDHEKKIAQINKHYDDEVAALKKKYSKELQATKEFQDALKKLSDQRKADIDAEDDKDRWDKIHTGAEMAQSVSDAIFEIGRNNRQAEADAQIANLERLKEKELDNKNLTEDQKAAINEKYRKQEAAIKLKAWQADKQAAMEQAIINGALAVVKALPNFLQAAAAGVAAAAQIAVIASQKPPEFEQGGYSAVDYGRPNGYVSKPTLFMNSASGRAFSAGEKFKTEYIISSEQLRDPVVADFVGMMESRRGVRRFEAGGYSNAMSKAAMQRQATVNVSAPVNLEPLLEEQRKTREAIANMELVFSFREFERYRAKVATAKENADG